MLKDVKKIYFMGIGGTGMASVAGLCKEAGYEVCGSDQGLYPPMSTLLEELAIPVLTPYSAANLGQEPADLYVVANALSKGHQEVQALLDSNHSYTSFPALMGDLFLRQGVSVVVTGTHGKTTTTALTSHLLMELGLDPSFMIGGIARNFSKSFRYSNNAQGFFVIEGDEYDTAFFDKNSKFLHYEPDYIIFNNLEFDHADIFADLAAIEKQFTTLFEQIDDPKKIIANIADRGVSSLLSRLGLLDKVTATAWQDGGHSHENLSALATTPTVVTSAALKKIQPTGNWRLSIASPVLGDFDIESILQGAYNASNITQVIGLIEKLYVDGKLSATPLREKADLVAALQKAFFSFKGIARRLEKIGEYQGAHIYEDFAHHPTAIAHVIDSYRRTHPKQKLYVAFEPKSATARRSVLMDDFAEALSKADGVYLGACAQDERIRIEQRMDTEQLAQKITCSAAAFPDNEALYGHLKENLQVGQSLIFMSSGSFSGIHHKLVRP